MTDDKPMMVNAEPARDQLATGIRYVLFAGAAIASALGFAEAAGRFNAVALAVGPVATAAIFLWGQWTTRRNSKQKAELAARLPDSVATFK